MNKSPRRLARRMAEMTSFKVVDFLEAAVCLEGEGRDIVRMETGEPAFTTAEPILAAAHRALEEDRTGYTPSCGIPELRQAIANHYRRFYGFEVDAGRVIVTTGSSAALSMICDLLLDSGDGMILSDPGYPCNANFLRRLEAEPQLVDVSAIDKFCLTSDKVAAAWRDNTRAVLVASPSNPTGEIIPEPEMRQLYAETSRRDGTLIVDEIYHGLTYDSEPVLTALALGDDVSVINSFSKYFGMTGWRLGWAVVPEHMVEPINILSQNFYISPPSLAQYAALAAFEPESLAILEQRREEFRRRRDYLVPALRELGFDIPHMPSGAFYIYAGIEAFSVDCEAFCRDMLHNHGVSITPGTDFGRNYANQHVRFAYTEPQPRLEEAIRRLKRALG